MTRRDLEEHLRFSLADTFIDGEWHRVSFNRIFSRIIFVFEVPIAFVLCRWRRDGTLHLFCRSVEDPLLRPQFLRDLETTTRDWERRPATAKNRLIPLFGTDVHVLLFRIVALPQRALGQPQTTTYEPIDSASEIWEFVRRVVRPFMPELPRIGINTHIERMLERAIKDSEIDDALWERRIAQDDAPVPISAEVQHIVDLAADKLQSLIDRRYKRIVKSPIMSPNGRKPANILFFAKCFDREQRRLGAYHYDCRPILGPAQTEDLLKALDPKRFTPLSASEWRYVPEAPHKLTEVKPRYPIAEHDRAFWQLLRRPDGPSEVLRRITQPLGEDTRLCVEYVATSGTVLVVNDPFRRGSLGWTGPRHNGAEVTDEELRLVCLHYLLLVLADQAHNPTLLMIPLRANGAPWMVAATVRGYSADEAPPIGNLLVNDHWFQRSYLLYHSLMRPLERRFRQSAERLFCDHVAEMFKKQLALLFLHPPNGPEISVKEGQIRDEKKMIEICSALNMQTHSLCRSYPLERVRFFTETQVRHGIHKDLAVECVDREFRFYIALEENPFFDRLQIGPFLTLSEVRDRVWERVMPWIEGRRSNTALFRRLADDRDTP